MHQRGCRARAPGHVISHFFVDQAAVIGQWQGYSGNDDGLLSAIIGSRVNFHVSGFCNQRLRNRNKKWSSNDQFAGNLHPLIRLHQW